MSDLRQGDVATINIGNNESLSSALDMSNYAGGMIIIPADLTGHVHFLGSEDGTNYYLIYDDTNTLIVLSPGNPSAAKCMAMPAKLFGVKRLKMQTHTGATNTTAQTQTGAKTIKVMLKS
jgi:hypothetical protein